MKSPNKTNTYNLHLALSKKDEEHVKLFQKTMGHTGKLKYIYNDSSVICGRKIAAVTMCSVTICQAGRFKDDLANLGVIQNKTKRIPPPRLDTDLLKLSYIRGYIDGDGSLAITNNKLFGLSFVSSCEGILFWIKEAIDRIFPISYMERDFSTLHRSVSSEAYQYRISGHRALRIVSVLSRVPTPELARKWKQPRLWELIEESKASYPEMWSIRLPIEDEIDAFLANTS